MKLLPRWALWPLTLLWACGPDTSPSPEPLGTSVQNLFYEAAILRTEREIPVCWLTAGYATEKGWVREALRGQRSWMRSANLNFVGWGDCAPGAQGVVIEIGGAYSAAYDGGPLTEVYVDFNDNVHEWRPRCVANDLDRRACIIASTLHEFGHVLGYGHEHQRWDSPEVCPGDLLGPDSTHVFGPYDFDSIMGYCANASQLSATDRVGTERLYGPPNADDPHLRDFNLDGKVDLLCHHTSSGTLYLDRAFGSGQFNGSDWVSPSGWCNTTEGRLLFTGDFNGDDRTDLLCFDQLSGARFVDRANNSGTFGGTDWSSSAAWCTASDTRQLLIGDYDGDGREDLLCYDFISGSQFIDYAGANGEFSGTNWSRANASFCNEDRQRVFVGDFNGDQRADLYCHDFATGSQGIDYADASGEFGGYDWTRAGGWCNGAETRTIIVGDYNGDGRDDLFCYDPRTGDKHLDYANLDGEFGGSNWAVANNWCTSGGSRLFVGDVNNDGRDDWVCHHVESGLKWVDLASESGQFLGTDWQSNAPWCSLEAQLLH
jgi:hypothetical protein